MPVLIIGSTKGGAGKSTLAVNITIELASQGKRVALIDADDQNTAMKFSNMRFMNNGGKLNFVATSCPDRKIIDVINGNKNYVDYIIIDGGGSDNEALRAALLVADMVLIPAQPQSTDLWEVEKMMDIVNKARARNQKLRSVVVINMADPSKARTTTAINFLKVEYFANGIEVLDFGITRRVAFDDAFSVGLGVSEMPNKDWKAIEEVRKLVSTLTEEMAGVK